MGQVSWAAGLLALATWASAGVPFKGRFFHTVQHFSPDCVYSEWTPWSACSAGCGLTGFSSRSRVVLEEPSGHGYGHHGEECDASSLEEWRDCLGEPCDADCQMSEWSAWGGCSADCGPGIRARARDVLSAPVGNGAPCGFTDQTQDCDNGPCAQDCILGDWAPWSACPACGPGSRSRARSIVQQGAFGGISCDFSDLSETEPCFSSPCAVDCQMGPWSAWSQCSSDCGAGRRQRLRSILTPAAFGGAPCGAIEDWESCDNGPCPQDCILGEWAPWSACPVCGPGSRSRSRSIAQQGAFGGLACDFSDLSETESCNSRPCQVDCQMSQWSQWSQCSASCGEGRRDRSRSVLVPAAFGGLACGPTADWQSCNNGPCARDCVLTNWAPWSACPACGPGSRSRQRSISQQGAFGGVTCDFADLSETESCNSRPCSVDCQMSLWSEWSECSADCGEGRRQRLRTVQVPAAFGGLPCGQTEEWEGCNSGPCPLDCILGDWAPWSSCPVCGPGSRSRSRSIAQEGAFGGLTCDFAALSETEQCNSRPCAVDCKMSFWSEWSECSADCGEGRRQRLRTIVTPAAFGGKACGETEEWAACNNGPCAQDCVLTAWAQWSACPACGPGSRTRQRSISQQGAFGGVSCDFQPLTESEACQSRPCSVDCRMSAWSAWSQCSAQCGEGRRDRSRSVLTPAAFGGVPCGPTADWEVCDSGPCPCPKSIPRAPALPKAPLPRSPPSIKRLRPSFNPLPVSPKRSFAPTILPHRSIVTYG